MAAPTHPLTVVATGIKEVSVVHPVQAFLVCYTTNYMQNWRHGNLAVYNSSFLKLPILHDAIDLIVTSPPYNVGIDYSQYQDASAYDDYLAFSRAWLVRALRVLRADGRCCLNIPLDKNKGGSHSVAADLTRLAQELGFRYHTTIVWNEGNISRRTAWGSFQSASAPYIITPVEVIVVFYKKVWRKQRRGVSDITKEEFMAWTNGLWTFNGESKKRVGHPAPFPLELPRRCIKLFSYVGDAVLDPFLGSGTTLIAAHELARSGIGVEIDPSYCALAVKRIIQERQLDQFALADAGETSASGS